MDKSTKALFIISSAMLAVGGAFLFKMFITFLFVDIFIALTGLVLSVLFFRLAVFALTFMIKRSNYESENE